MTTQTKTKGALARITSATATLVAKPGVTLVDVVRGIQDARHATDYDAGVVAEPTVTLPQPVSVSNEALVALAGMVDTLNGTKFPDTRRELTEPEQRELLLVLEKVKTATEPISAATDSVKAALFNHLDVVAEAAGKADPKTTPRSAKGGWYLIPGVVRVAGLAHKATREVRSGQTSVSAEALEVLAQAGDITRADYLAATKQVRVVDEDRFLGLLKRAPHLAEKISKAFKVSAPSVSLYQRKA